MDASGSNWQRLTFSSDEDGQPAWSPDGKKIAFSRSEYPNFNNGEIYVMNSDGSNQTNLTNNPAADFFPDWSPDGAKIAFASGRDGISGIYVMDADGSHVTRLTTISASEPRWSPDGTKIAFTTDRDGNNEIYVMNADGSNPVRLTNNSTNDYQSCWSPDGAKIAFTSGGIYVMNADGSNPVAISDGSEPDWQRSSALPTPTPTPTPIPTPPPCPFCWQPVTLSQNFDDVTPPALPQDWTATNVQGPAPLWVTSNSGVPSPPAESKPNAAFVDDPSVISDKVLDSLSFSVFEGISPRLTFRHNFNLEASGMNPVLGFDGGVLEISLDNGQTYQDILQMGGNFVTGGYNRTISTDRGSPIAGRQAWSGNSGGFMTTTVNLPPIIDHATLRWRMASDNSGSGEGWRIDNVQITWCQGPPCSPTPPPPTPTPTPSVTPTPSAPPTPTATPTATPTTLGNISTRLRVETGDNVLIGGFIITGSSGSTKTVVIRGIGPSLNVNGIPVAARLTDPLIELHKPDGSIVTNDNWRDAANAGGIPFNLQPSDNREAAILTMLAPGDYTVIVKGAQGETGVGLVEAYDLEQASPAKLANISTRGFVQTGDDVMIGGFIITGPSGSTIRVVMRGIGPSLSVNGVPVPGKLADPLIELHKPDGSTLANDNWRDAANAGTIPASLQPVDDRESAILTTLAPGPYTVIVKGAHGETGIGLVEAFQLDN